jgi:EAL domain-containing protein (putative c-di-GMP-specific phosphodiesterase class I)
MEQLTYLHDTLGVRLSIDDFGTGYSSLAYISRFPLDELKVDRSFVLGMEQSDNFAKITAAIIAMARQLELDIVVEGVDSQQQYRTIREYGASVIQGYLFSRPLPLKDLEAFIGEKTYLNTLAELDA